MGNHTTGIVATQTRWYRSLTRVHLTTLAASVAAIKRGLIAFAAELFDGFETCALILAVAAAAPSVNGAEATSRPRENRRRSWRYRLSRAHVDHIAFV